MSDFKNKVSQYYLDYNKREIDKNKDEEFKGMLSSVDHNDLKTLDDHREYIEALHDFRVMAKKALTLSGSDLDDFLKSVLSVGENGIYNDKEHFIFELIQNADDCDYSSVINRELNIQFNITEGRIVFRYNEDGFSPRDVFSVTGIAETMKNKEQKKIQIGEKGIGFKSVFGIAERVLVQSGKFSFVLYKDNPTIPDPSYSNFSGIQGTQITLFVKPEKISGKERSRGEITKEIYDKLLKYCSYNNALFTRSPILFLRNLTKIRIFFDEENSIEFSVEKGKETNRIDGGIDLEENVIISSKISSTETKQREIKDIKCYRYIMPIKYNREMCISRYSKETKLSERNMTFQIVIPHPDEDISSSGTLYSYLPTLIRIRPSFACHIPFKLSASREYIDSQGNNEWFMHSINTFAKMLKYVYIDLAKKVKQKILKYLPANEENFFRLSDNDKTRCLNRSCFLGSNFTTLSIFYTESGRFLSADKVFSFKELENVPEQINVNKYATLKRLLKNPKELFIPTAKPICPFDEYGFEVVTEIYKRLFNMVLKGDPQTNEILRVIDENYGNYPKLIGCIDRKVTLPLKAICDLSVSKKCFAAFNSNSIDWLKYNKLPIVTITDKPVSKHIKYIISNEAPLELTDISDKARNYLERISYNYITAPFKNDECFFVAQNILVLSETDTLGSFAQFLQEINKKDFFAAKLTMRAASERLNDADDSMAVSDYMRLLRSVRKSIKDVLGEKTYQSYITIIKQLNPDSKRFIRELLQNADDCEYTKTELPSFRLSVQDGYLTTEYNEDGFTRDNVRAITAIGESTKKKLYNDEKIGEKGIGFKTVFSVAKKIDVHSGDFNFSLTSQEPTIPVLIAPPEQPVVGTTMLFALNKDNIDIKFSNDEIIALCLCLRKLKDIYIGNQHVLIEDKDGKRIIKTNDREYTFEIFSHSFEVNDESALTERSHGNKSIDKHQKIVIYVPEKEMPQLKYYLYCGLPTSIEARTNLMIDAPFELTSSRDNVIKNRWNEYVLREVRKAYILTLESLAKSRPRHVLKYLSYKWIQGLVSQHKFVLFECPECEWMEESNILTMSVKKARIIRTFSSLCTTTANDTSIRIYPKLIQSASDTIDELASLRSKIIYAPTKEYVSTLKALGCRETDFVEITGIIKKYSNYFTEDQNIRRNLYEYLIEVSDRIVDANLKSARIIPVKSSVQAGAIDYISYNSVRDNLYVEEHIAKSPPDYSVLDTDILSKKDFEEIFDEHVPLMNDEQKKHQYAKKISRILDEATTNSSKYEKIMKEFSTNRELFNDSYILFCCKGRVPFKTENGEYLSSNVFYTSSLTGYFSGDVINSHLVCEEATELARATGVADICSATYKQLDIRRELTEDDIEDLKSEKIENSFSILQSCYSDGLISEELVEKYKLDGIIPSIAIEYDEDDFPEDWIDPLIAYKKFNQGKIREIIKIDVTESVPVIKLDNGKHQGINTSEIQQRAFRKYRPYGETHMCFCQMCQSVKNDKYMEARNIVVDPKYYQPDTRLSLCLECGKRFYLLRSNKVFLESFHNKIKSADITSKKPISIPIGDREIRFTQKHLAQIQSILKSGKY